MGRHQFGGEWTAEKLDRVRKYLPAYMTIFRQNPRARHFATTYVDAFAGTGHRIERRELNRGQSLFDKDAEEFKAGSARIALEAEPSFDRYIFIERDVARIADLKRLVADFPHKSAMVSIERGDANDFLSNWCTQTDWRSNRAVVFLDPYGMQVRWATLESIAKTKAIDLWLLFPLGVAVSRLLTRQKPPSSEWSEALTRIFGTDRWQPAFYPTHEETTLFGQESVQRREADWEGIGRFFNERLMSIFAKVADNPLPLRNSRGTPIYLLCFAAGNPRGAPTAVRIAQHILRP